jgi:hypothetical protein
MIHYHGLPITPATAAVRAIAGGHAFVSFREPLQLGIAIECAASFALDNGAFSAWRSGSPVTDWSDYYRWVGDARRLPGFDWAVIPDVIDGDESANDHLCDTWPFAPWEGVPVWHMHESLDRLGTLAATWPRVALGSSGQWPTPGAPSWWRRIGEAMGAICDPQGRPACRLHGLRMLDPDIFTRIPFASADSTNIARNIGIDQAWRGTYTPPSKEARAAVMRERIESHQSPPLWLHDAVHPALFELTA